MNRRNGGFSIVEMMVVLAITAFLMVATYAVVASVIRSDENNRIRVEMQVEASNALRKISDLLKMAGPTGTIAAWAPGNYPIFALDQLGGGFPSSYGFLDSASYQTPPPSGPSTVTNDGVQHLAPSTDTDGYYGTSNEIAFQLPRPSPFYYLDSSSPAPPAGKQENPLDDHGIPTNLAGQVTWGVSQALYNWYQDPAKVAGAGLALADRQTDVYAIVLVPTSSLEIDALGNHKPGPNQLELREYSYTPTGVNRLFIRKTVLATRVERIVFASSPFSAYYLTQSDPLGATFSTTGDPTPRAAFQDKTLGPNQLSVTIWMWRDDLNKGSSGSITSYRVKQSITVTLRSVGRNQLGS
jgi:prepilin-type N-terminal cleavage/methylation domain-containing protein